MTKKYINLEDTDYPYYKLIKNDKEITKTFNELKKYNPQNKYSLYNKSFKQYTLNFEREEDFLRLTDYFSEEERSKCQFNNIISKYDWYQQNRDKIIQKFGKKADYFELDYYIWRNTHECSNFPVVMAMEILKHFKVKKWLDPSAGWGDRLIAAIAYGCEYNAFDPNKKMQKNYQNIIDFFGKNNKDYSIIAKPFEKAKVKSNYYDLVFTSPPFFNLEDYDEEKTQSHRAYKTLKEWKEKFLYPLLNKSKEALVNRGHLALYISNYPGYTSFVSDTMFHISENLKMKYKGNITWTLTNKRKRFIYIWQK